MKNLRKLIFIKILKILNGRLQRISRQNIDIFVALNGTRLKFAYKVKREEFRYYIVDNKEFAENT